MSNELLTTSFFKMVFLAADKDDDCKITLKQLGELTIVDPSKLGAVHE